MTLKQVVEALVFASPKPLLTKEIVAALRAAGESSEDPDAQSFSKSKEDEVLAALAEVESELIASGRAFRLVERVNGWALVSDSSCAVWVRQLYPEAKPTRLTGPQLETLAIIAYRQPVTRADCEAVRGVAVDGVMQVLLDRGLVKIAGRAEVPGRPLLYSTTEYFLQHFGLKTTDELPNAGELKRVALPTAKVEEPEAPATGEDGAPAPKKGRKPKEAPAAAAETAGATPEGGVVADAETPASPAEEAPAAEAASEMTESVEPSASAETPHEETFTHEPEVPTPAEEPPATAPVDEPPTKADDQSPA